MWKDRGASALPSTVSVSEVTKDRVWGSAAWPALRPQAQGGRQKNLPFLSGGPPSLSLSQHYFKNVTRGSPCLHPSVQGEGEEADLAALP